MSLFALSAAFKQELPPVEKLVLIALANYANDQHTCWPAMKTLAADTSLSIRSIIRYIATLENRGLIERTTRRSSGVQRSNLYRLTFLGDSLSLGDDDSDNDSNEFVTQPSDTVVTLPGVSLVTHEPSLEPSSEPKKGTRLSDDYRPRPADLNWAATEYPSIDVARETTQFVNYWCSKPGKAGVKLNWHLTWRNWIINAYKFAQSRGGAAKPTAGGLRQAIVAGAVRAANEPSPL